MGGGHSKNKTKDEPPEARGLPFIGNAIAFDLSPVNFVQKNSLELGSIFKTEVVGQEMAFLVGNTAVNAFLDEENVSRAKPIPYMAQILAGGEKRIVAFLDGAEHIDRREFLGKMLTNDCINDYLVVIDEIISENLPQLAGDSSVSAFKLFCRMQAQFIGRIVGGFPKDWVDQHTKALVTIFDAIAAGLDSKLPIDIPFTAFGTAITKENTWISLVEESLKEREKLYLEKGKDESSLPRDFITHLVVNNLSREVHNQLSVPLLARELNHLTIANYGVSSLMSYIILALCSHSTIKQKVSDEVKTLSKTDKLTTVDLDKLTYTNMFIRETLRYFPVVPILTGTAKRDFTVDGVTIKSGWGVMVGVLTTNRDPKVYPKPDEFDPERFSDARAEDLKAKCPMAAYIPQGGGNPHTAHRCLGEMFSRYVVKFYLNRILSKYEFTLISEQKVSIDFNRFALTPCDGCLIKLDNLQ